MCCFYQSNIDVMAKKTQQQNGYGYLLALATGIR
jgi:hypothetical protein